jgi:hypothetical protein
MKGNKIIVGFWLLLAIGIILGSCKKNEGPKTIALIGTEYYIGKDYSIEDILSAIPDSVQQEFDSIFGDIPNGPIPPSIAVPDSIMETDSVESYVVHPNHLVSTNLWNISSPIVRPDAYMRFSEQHNGIMVMELYEESLEKTDTVFVRGNNEDFAIYFVENKGDEYVRRGVIMCGKVREDGLSNFRMAFIVLDAIGDQAPDPGTYYIYKDGDSLVERCAWPW